MHYTIGVDEAGRGPLAGAVFAAAVVLPETFDLPYLNDSKKLSEKRRDVLFDQIHAQAVAFAVSTASVAEIDALNILQATMLAMTRAVNAVTAQLSGTFDALIDGNSVPSGLAVPARAIIGGDAQEPCIMAASVLAKVSRDRYMSELGAQYPQYGFAKHKGYGTKAHAEAIRRYGASPEHRALFIRKII